MQNPHPLPSEYDAEFAADERVDAICDAYEEAFVRGDDPDLASYLSRCEPSDRSQLFPELLLVDVEVCAVTDESSWSEYLDRFPEFSAAIEAARLKHKATSTSQPKPRRQTRATQRIGRFELVAKLGAGASGEVWKARDPRLRATWPSSFRARSPRPTPR